LHSRKPRPLLRTFRFWEAIGGGGRGQDPMALVVESCPPTTRIRYEWTVSGETRTYHAISVWTTSLWLQ